MVIFLHGADTYRSRAKLREITQKFRKEVDPQGYNLSVLSGAQTTAQAVLSALSAAPFLARKRMVVLEEYSEMTLKDEEKESLTAAAEKASKDDVLFVVWEGAVDKRSLKQKFFGVLLASKFAMEFPAMEAPQVLGFMRTMLDQAGVQLENPAWNYLAVAIEGNVWLAASETQKMIAFAQAKQLSRLDLAAVKVLVASGAHDDVFALVDLVSQGRSREAMTQLHEQYRTGSHPLELSGMLIRQYRLLQQVYDGLQQGLSAEAIAKVYKIHPFVVKKMQPQLRRIDPAAIRRGYALLTSLDREIKRSGIDAETLMSKAVYQLVSQP